MFPLRLAMAPQNMFAGIRMIERGRKLGKLYLLDEEALKKAMPNSARTDHPPQNAEDRLWGHSG